MLIFVHSTTNLRPNRRFVVEWTNLSILDENGTDLKASLTFEAVLFEGSNDVQFLYQILSGPRSDGSSATVGMQNSLRGTGILSVFNRASIGNGYFFSYRYQFGYYTAAPYDITPPSTPVVTDGGARSQSLTELWASWTTDDPETGIRNYEYAIGKAPGQRTFVPSLRQFRVPSP